MKKKVEIQQFDILGSVDISTLNEAVSGDLGNRGRKSEKSAGFHVCEGRHLEKSVLV
jgi:hypothetical protein